MEGERRSGREVEADRVGGTAGPVDGGVPDDSLTEVESTRVTVQKRDGAVDKASERDKGVPSVFARVGGTEEASGREVVEREAGDEANRTAVRTGEVGKEGKSGGGR